LIKMFPFHPSVRLSITIDLMEVGDSLFVLYDGYVDHESCCGSIARLATRLKQKLGYKYTIRSLADGVRIWRVE
jgi:hypothetical protein